jgi:hypothetical protein
LRIAASMISVAGSPVYILSSDQFNENVIIHARLINFDSVHLVSHHLRERLRHGLNKEQLQSCESEEETRRQHPKARDTRVATPSSN